MDETWLENDDLVNTLSATAPFGAPTVHLSFLPTDLLEDRQKSAMNAFSKTAALSDIRPGVWNVFPTYDGDHMALQGGLVHKHHIRGFYEALLYLIQTLV